jgi:transposase
MAATAQSAIAEIGIDIGKNSFHVVGLDGHGAIELRQKWSRGQVEARFANMSPCLIGMEACVGAHHLSRKLKALGHDARLMPARYVRPYSKGQKNDFRDAEAIAEAVQRPTMKFVATKTADQLDLQALHRVRERLVSTGIRMRKDAAELLALAPDVVLATTAPIVVALRQVSRTRLQGRIGRAVLRVRAAPIAFATVIDPVGAGVVASLARPGGNATGFITFEYGISGPRPQALDRGRQEAAAS